MTESRNSLVLNATYEPLCTVSARRALLLVVAGKAITVERVESAERTVHSATLTLVMPTVVKLSRFVRVPYRGAVPLTRRALFARDGGRCAYCGASAATIDHVVPRSRGGSHTWDNVVSACHRCNHQKADRAVHELGWRMRTVPRPPTGVAWRILSSGRCDPTWVPYLDQYAGGDGPQNIDELLRLDLPA